MSLLWHFYWPAIVAGLVIGILAGRHGFRRASENEAPAAPKKKGLARYPLLIGMLAAFAVGSLWHSLVAGQQYARHVEGVVAVKLADLEMTSVRARLERGPMRRTLLLNGPADDFQRTELVKLMGRQQGVSSGRWIDPPQGKSALLPLFVEAGIMALIGFVFGLLLAYLLELRRRSNAGWSW